MQDEDQLAPTEPTAAPGADVGATPETQSAGPAGTLWLVYLFFRPRLFFRHFVVEPIPGLTALCAWIYGISGVIDEIDMRSGLSRPMPFADSWGAHWGFILVAGVVAGLLYFAIGGWWYRVRLCWSGAEDPDRRLARRVYLFASQVVAIPFIDAKLLETGHFPTPAAASDSASGWYALLLVFPFWLAWTSYVGVRSTFSVRRGLALLWFLLLPGLFYVAVLGVMVIIMVLSLVGPADVDNPIHHDSTTMRFSYAGNWWIDDTHEYYNPDADLYVEPMQAAWVHIMVYQSDRTVAAELEATLTSFRPLFEGASDGETFDTWGTYRGNGRVLRGALEGTPAVFRAFVSRVGDGTYLEVNECWATADQPDVRPGFELIRSTFRLKP